MAEKFERGSLIVLILMVIFALLVVITERVQEKKIYDIIAITDARTEQLLQRVNEISDKVGIKQKM